MMVILPAAFLALSVHILPAIAIAFPSPQGSTSQCSTCTTVTSAFTSCNVDLSATTYTTTEETCLCNYSNFPSATTSCFACLGEADPGIESYCASITSGSSSASSATRSTTRSATASRTSAASSPTGSSSSDCTTNSACTSLASTLSGCGVTQDDLAGTISDADMTCMCSSRTFESDIAGCLDCLGSPTTGSDILCDAYVSSASGSATRTVASTRATSTSGSDSSETTASSPTGSSGSGSGSTTGLTSGLATNQNGGAGSLTVPGLIVPALVMAAAAWRMMF